MTIVRCTLHVALAAGALLGVAAGGDPFEDLERAITLSSQAKAVSGADRERLEEIRTSLARLAGLYRRSEGRDSAPGPLPESYSRSLTADAEVLRALPEGAPERGAAILDVRDDLRLKLRFANSGLGFAGGFPAVVRVTVETVRAGKKVDGLYVRGNPRRYGITGNPAIVFNSASSPTTTQLPPGLFVLWVESADKKVLASQPMEIGADGSDSQTIRFALP